MGMIEKKSEIKKYFFCHFPLTWQKKKIPRRLKITFIGRAVHMNLG